MLNGTLDLVAVGVRCGVRDVGVKETEEGGEGAADGFRVRAECRDVVASGVVGGDHLFEAGHDVVLVLGLGACTVTRIFHSTVTFFDSYKLY